VTAHQERTSHADAYTHRERLWTEDPEIQAILREGETLDDARQALFAHLCDLEWRWHSRPQDSLDPLEAAVAQHSIAVFKALIAPANERRCGFSTLKLLRDVANERASAATLAPGFCAEILHLLRGIHGRSGIGTGWMGSRWGVHGLRLPLEPMPPMETREKGALRSSYLDRMGGLAREIMARYPAGLDPAVWRRTQRNRERILHALGATAADWASPEWQRTHAFTERDGYEALRRIVVLSSEEDEALRLASEAGVPWGITPYYLSLFALDRSDRALDGQPRAQVLPPIHTVRCMVQHAADRDQAFDFMGEADTSPVEHVTRRYPMVAILKVAETCPQICVYCQRNWEIRPPRVDGVVDRGSIEEALRWFAQHPTVIDVLVTGGDPLILPVPTLRRILGRLAQLPHIRHLRVGTRVPVTMPMGVTEEIAAMLGGLVWPGRRSVSLVTHVESPLEVTPAFVGAVGRLRRRGVGVYNQLVYTLETSRRFQTAATRVALKAAGVDPYYTFYTKGKDEHRRYLVPIARILQERKEEARLLPGIFRTDEPVFNVPRLGKTHLRAGGDRELIGIRGDGRRVYLFHPWEKGIAPTAPWVYVDVSIHDYLRRLERLGEDPAYYRSLWHYH
jgi:lysine 2,3-aminomutase